MSRVSKEYRTWSRMIARCHDESHPRYPWYGARGISVCQEWRDSFQAFLDHVGPAPTAGHTIDRHPDNDGDYAPGNVRWATMKEQGQNRRSTRLLEHGGVSLSLAAWAEARGMDRRVLHKRLARGWATARAIEEPVRRAA